MDEELWDDLDPGTLRHRVQIQSQSTSPSSFGGQQQTWTTVLTTWASIEAVTQRELLQAGQLTSQVTHTITTWFNSSVTVKPGMRILFGSHVYKVQALNNVLERNWAVKILVLELNGAE